jgi:2-C-methyl-D-erythritol 4-phosphate cytidylyltransferase
MARYPGTAVEISAIVPLSTAVSGHRAAFASLAGEPPLVRILRTLLAVVAEPAAVVATAEPQVADVRECLAAHGLAIDVAVATDTRAHCLTAGLEYLESKAISARSVLIHDIRRPLASAGLCDRVTAELRRGSAVVMPTLPLTDSVKAVDARGSVIATLDRSVLQAVQYPRGFATDQLARLLDQRMSDEFDELEEVIRDGMPITVVDGDSDAFVAELPRDAAFVEAIIACGRTEDS